MRKLNNILYVTSPDCYLSLDGENIVILKDEEEQKRIPLHNLEGIITFGYTGASPALMGKCAKKHIALTFLTSHGNFLARVSGEQYGNVFLRKEQYRVSEQSEKSLDIAKNMMIGKLYNARWVLERCKRDHPLQVDTNLLYEKISSLKEGALKVKEVPDAARLLGVEGKAADEYFSVFDQMILQQKDDFKFVSRNRRPPKDKVNALLSFAYTLLAHDCAAALESVGLDAYVGFYHKDRPGRISLALDLMEELRAVIADRFALTLINKKIVNKNDFWTKENGAVMLTDESRRTVLQLWQKRKNDVIQHPFLNAKLEWGLVPFAQAQLLARYLRGDLEEYPPFLWK